MANRYEVMMAQQHTWADSHGADKCPACGDTGITDLAYHIQEDERTFTRSVWCLCPMAEYQAGMTWQQIKARQYRSAAEAD